MKLHTSMQRWCATTCQQEHPRTEMAEWSSEMPVQMFPQTQDLETDMHTQFTTHTVSDTDIWTKDFVSELSWRAVPLTYYPMVGHSLNQLRQASTNNSGCGFGHPYSPRLWMNQKYTTFTKASDEMKEQACIRLTENGLGVSVSSKTNPSESESWMYENAQKIIVLAFG